MSEHQSGGDERMRRGEIDAAFTQAHQKKQDDQKNELEQLKASEQTLPPEPVDEALIQEADEWEQGALTEERAHELKILGDLEEEQKQLKGEIPEQ